jgi:hypothetical protein
MRDVIVRVLAVLIVVVFVLSAGYSWRTNDDYWFIAHTVVPGLLLGFVVFHVPKSMPIRASIVALTTCAIALWLVTDAWLHGGNLDLGSLAMRAIEFGLLVYLLYFDVETSAEKEKKSS